MRSIVRAVHLTTLLCASAVLSTTAFAQAITPKFSWPTSGSADVRTTGWTSLQGVPGAQDDSTGFRAEGRLTSTSHPDGWVIANGPTRMLEGRMLETAGLDAFQQVVTRHVVSAEGRFLRLEDTLALRQRVDSASEKLMARFPPQLREAMAATFSIESLRAQSEQQWAQLVGLFASRSWTAGDSVHGTERQLMPGMPGGVSVYTISTYEGETACPASTTATVCWRFRTRRTIDSAQLKQAARVMMKLTGMTDEALANVPIPSSTTETVLELVADSKGFVPLESAMSLSSKTTMPMPDGTSVTMQQRMASTTQYNWR